MTMTEVENVGMSSNLMWVEKYRPAKLSDIIAQDSIQNTLRKFLENRELMPHLLFYGPPGTGKTSTILSIVKELYGEKFIGKYVLELNASDARGIDVIRDKIKEFASTQLMFSSGKKIVILDEADQMTAEAQAALRRIIETYSERTRFCIICNYINNITSAIKSRCTRFRFSPIPPSIVYNRLTQIADLEGVQYDHEAIEAIVKVSGGDMRRCIMILQSTCASVERLTEKAVYESIGLPTPLNFQTIIYILFNDDFAEATSKIKNIQVRNGFSLRDIVHEVFLYTTRLKIPSDLLTFLINELSFVEECLIDGASEKLQLSHLVGTFHMAREAIGESISIDVILNEDIALNWKRNPEADENTY